MDRKGRVRTQISRRHWKPLPRQWSVVNDLMMLKSHDCTLYFLSFFLNHWHYSHFSRTEHDDVIKWNRFPRYWPFVRGIQRSPVDSPHKGQWRGALMFSLIRAWTNDWTNNRSDGDLKRNRAHYNVIVMEIICITWTFISPRLRASPPPDKMLSTHKAMNG